MMDFNWIGRRVPTPDVERIITGALDDDVEQVGATAALLVPAGGRHRVTAAGARGPRGRDRARTRDGRAHRRRAARASASSTVTRSRSTGSCSRCRSASCRAGSTICRRTSRRRVRGPRVPGDPQRQPRSRRPVPLGQALGLLLRGRVSVPPPLVPGELQPANVPPGKSSVSTEVAYSRASPLERDTLVERTIAALRTAANILAPDDDDRVRPRGGDPSRLRDLRPRPRAQRRH